MKKIILIICCILCISCTNYSDINNLAIVNEIAIDYTNEFKIYLKVLSSNQENENKIYIESCETIDECFSKINNQLTKKLYLTHLDLLIFSNNLEKEQYDEIFNFFLNEDSSRNTFSTIIVSDINEDFLNIDSKDIENLIDLSQLVINKSLDTIIKETLELKVSYIPFIDIENTKVNGYKMIYEDTKLLSQEESIIINFINNDVDKISLLIDNNIFEIENCELANKIKDNNINVNIRCDYHGKKKSKVLIENYIKEIFNNYINTNNLNIFYNLLYKYNKDYKEINTFIDVDINTININTGDLFE